MYKAEFPLMFLLINAPVQTSRLPWKLSFLRPSTAEAQQKLDMDMNKIYG